MRPFTRSIITPSQKEARINKKAAVNSSFQAVEKGADRKYIQNKDSRIEALTVNGKTNK